ncbi:hypothetical protein GCM10010191_67750 [Actinomadura vinacea]|uniref:Secreted protein n=1 Tax=Actinomadura vinacea TaxID=115336 RepID=A0ABN3JWY0_9ACTN
MIAPAAIAVAALTAAVPAAADASPVDKLSNDLSKKTVNGSLPGQVADAAQPLVRVPATLVHDVLNAKPGLASVNPGGSRARLGSGTLRTAHGDLRFKSLTARCEKGLDGVVRGVTEIDPEVALTGSLTRVPTAPPANFRVPLASKGPAATLNKQVRDATGALTVTGASITDQAGVTRDFGVARCAGNLRADVTGAGARKRPEPKEKESLTDRTIRSLGDLVSLAQLGQIPGLQAFSVPGLPGSGGSKADISHKDPSAGAPQGGGGPAAGPPKPKSPKAKSPKAKSPKAKTSKAKSPKVKAPQAKVPEVKAPHAGAPRPANAGNQPRPAHRIAYAPAPGGLLPYELATTVTGMPGQVAGTVPPAPGGILGGAPGLPLVG